MSHSQCIPRTLLQVTSAPVCDHWIAKQGQYHVEVEFIPKPLMWLHIYETIYHCWLKDIGVLIRNSHIFTILEITWEAIFFITFPFCTSVKYGHEKDNNNDDNKNNDSLSGQDFGGAMGEEGTTCTWKEHESPGARGQECPHQTLR